MIMAVHFNKIYKWNKIIYFIKKSIILQQDLNSHPLDLYHNEPVSY